MQQTIHLVDSASSLASKISLIKIEGVLGTDIETSSLDPISGDIMVIQLSDDENTLVIDVRKIGYETVAYHLRPIFESLEVVKCFHNAKFDLSFIWSKLDIKVERIFDSMLASILLQGGIRMEKGFHSLKETAKRHTGIILDKTEQSSDWTQELTDDKIKYAAEDAQALLPLREELIKKLRQLNLIRVAKLEFECVLPVVWLELSGFYLDFDQWKANAVNNLAQSKIIAAEIYKELQPVMHQGSLFGDAEINLDSHVQIQKYFRALGIPMPDSTREPFLTPLVPEYSILGKLLEYRGLAKSSSTFGESWEEFINPITGRIHADFWQIGAEDTGRFSCSGPNLQQLPKDNAFRNCFKGEGDNTLISGDYSQIELRLLADIAKDKSAVAAFAAGKDFHDATAELINRPRRLAKNCLAGGTLILTDKGEIPIEAVTLAHKVWDGVEWVRHDGIVDQGLKRVITYDGITGTRDHVVYTDKGRLTLEQVSTQQVNGRSVKIEVTSRCGVPIKSERYSTNIRSRFIPTLSAGFSHLLLLQLHCVVRFVKFSFWKKYPMSAFPKERSKICVLFLDLLWDKKTLFKFYLQRIQELWGPWNQIELPVKRQFCGLLYEGIPYDWSQMRTTARSNTQQWELRNWKLAVCNTETESAEQTNKFEGFSSREEIQVDSGCTGLYPFKVSRNTDVEFDTDTEMHILEMERGKVPDLQAGAKVQRVFDIVNAGPRHRFTANGRLVANCNFAIPYGATAPRVAATANISVLEAEILMEAYFKAFPNFKKWINQQKRNVLRTHYARSVSGRLTRLIFDENDFGMRSAAQRNAVNMPIQGSSADILKRALRLFYDSQAGRHDKVKLVNIVHDEINVECSENLAQQVAQELNHCMVAAGEEYVEEVQIKVDMKISKFWQKD